MTNTTSSHHKNTRNLYMSFRDQSPSTSPPPTHPPRRSPLGIQCRTMRATRGWASSSSRHPTTPSYKSRRWCSYRFPASRAERHPPQPSARGHYSTPRSTPPRFRRFASRPRPPNSRHHATTPSNYCRSRCFPLRLHPPPTFRCHISRFGPCQTPHLPHSSARWRYWSSMTTRHHMNTPSYSFRRHWPHRVSPRHPPQSGSSASMSATTMSPPRRSWT